MQVSYSACVTCIDVWNVHCLLVKYRLSLLNAQPKKGDVDDQAVPTPKAVDGVTNGVGTLSPAIGWRPDMTGTPLSMLDSGWRYKWSGHIESSDRLKAWHDRDTLIDARQLRSLSRLTGLVWEYRSWYVNLVSKKIEIRSCSLSSGNLSWEPVSWSKTLSSLRFIFIRIWPNFHQIFWQPFLILFSNRVEFFCHWNRFFLPNVSPCGFVRD